MRFPSVTEYEDAISSGTTSFKTLDLEFELSNPAARIWVFGAGQFAVVFKAKIEGKYYAIRCFQHATKKGLEKYSVLSKYLNRKKIPWLSKFNYIDDEILVGSKRYPVLVMDWVEGIDIHDFITSNLQSNYWLLQLQKSLISLSKNLEKKKIGHGDLQKGNVIVSKEKEEVVLKLIDYDGMFVEPMQGEESIELGKPDLQHPKREKSCFNERIDRFSIWLIITALEALKYDKSLWQNITEGGFNDGSNFLFKYEDLNNSRNSKLFSKLLNSSDISVKEFATQLQNMCHDNIDNIIVPKLLDSVKLEKKESFKEDKSKDKKESSIFGIPSSSKLKRSGIKEKEANKKGMRNKKVGKEFDVEDKQGYSKSSTHKKGGKQFDVEDPKDRSNAEKLLHARRVKNMFVGLFVLTSILSLFLIFRYSDSALEIAEKKNQVEAATKSIQILKEDLNNMTDDRDSWRSDYYTMESSRDSWRSDYYTMESSRDHWEGQFYTMQGYRDNWYSKYNSKARDYNTMKGYRDNWYNKYNALVPKWNKCQDNCKHYYSGH